ncbi:MAG TPA: papain-like cysteine protease family protein [Anaerolineaceae bacterium]|nr:papain-like cysteine protease family protein [Anaerolineaceae bacterium]
MVFSALDYYFDQKNVPDYQVPDVIPVNYAKYLWKRQKESVSFTVLLRIIYFSSLSVKSSIKKSIVYELPKIKYQLSDNLPAPLILIRASLIQNPTHNHQVLVTGFKENGSITELLIYDPNHPEKQPTIEIDRYSHKINQSTGEFIRGFFLNKYSYKSSEADK